MSEFSKGKVRAGDVGKVGVRDVGKEKNNYVYAYYFGASIVYVGIGKESKVGDFSRAFNLEAHAKVYATYGEARRGEVSVSAKTRELHKKGTGREATAHLEVQVVARQLTRKSARAVESLLIKTLWPLQTLLNVRQGGSNGGRKVTATTKTRSDGFIGSAEIVTSPVTARAKTKGDAEGPFTEKGTQELLVKSGCVIPKAELLGRALIKDSLRREDFPGLTAAEFKKCVGGIFRASPWMTEKHERWVYRRVALTEEGREGRRAGGMKGGKIGGKIGGIRKRKYLPEDAKIIQAMQTRLFRGRRRGEDLREKEKQLEEFKKRAIAKFTKSNGIKPA